MMLKDAMLAKIVDSFPLTVGAVWRQYTKMPDNGSDIFYHYTTKVGLKGILRSGGLRATYRMRMSDTGEFDYAKEVIFEALNEVGKRRDLPPVAQSLTVYTRKNLDQFLKPTKEKSSSYCSCLTVSNDHQKQWETYAEDSKGFAIGFNLLQVLKMQVDNVPRGEPYIFCAPVTYNEIKQRDLVWQLVKAGIDDLQLFSRTVSSQSEDLTALRDRVMKEIVIHLFVLINFLKDQAYNSEHEVRLMLDSNDGSLAVKNVQYYPLGSESIPYIFMDLRNPTTTLLPLAEIKIGPKASFTKERRFLEDLLKELGYNRNNLGGPRIIHSRLVAD